MAEREDGGPAFPVEMGSQANQYFSSQGMSLRDWFAGQALDTLINKSEDRDGGWCVHTVAAGAYALADAMLAARKEGGDDNG
jgi:hypothetical protein